MSDVILEYQRVMPNSETRRRVALMLRIAAIATLAFAFFAGWEVFYRAFMEKQSAGWTRIVDGEDIYYVKAFKYVYHWNRLPWIAAAMFAPTLLAGIYWFLARAILQRQDRTITVAALALTMLHTLAATLCLLLAIILGSANLSLLKLNLPTLIEAAGCLLIITMVPGMCYLSIRLMDLLKERPIPPPLSGETISETV